MNGYSDINGIISIMSVNGRLIAGHLTILNPGYLKWALSVMCLMCIHNRVFHKSMHILQHVLYISLSKNNITAISIFHFVWFYFSDESPNAISTIISMAYLKTAVSSLLTHWIYYSLALSHHYLFCPQKGVVSGTLWKFIYEFTMAGFCNNMYRYNMTTYENNMI